MPGTLFVVATPIGNLADISLRALTTLREVDIIAAEDTRVTGKLLKRYEITTPMTPYHQHSLGAKARQLVDMLLEGKTVALVSDAGTPGISDPGHEIINLAIESDISVISIPGATAFVSALVISGLPTRRFIFEGFPPRRPGERVSFFTALKSEPRTLVFYEAPSRLLPTLRAMHAAWGDRKVAVAREVTKMFEEVHRGTVSSAIERFTTTPPRGEITLIAEGCADEIATTTVEIREALLAAMSAGKSSSDAVRAVASALPVPKKEVYRIMLQIKEKPSEE